jgi:glycosyltransferase involved in cell wall biosynthesis
MWRAASRIAATEMPDIVHCRSYLPLELGARLKRRFGLKYKAEFRDFWADVGNETKRIKRVYKWFLKREPSSLGNADHVVTLTERATAVLIKRHPHVVGGRRENYTVIPCCADFGLFDPALVNSRETSERRRELDIPAAAPVMLYLGSLGPDYLLGPMMALFRELHRLRQDAIFVFLVNNGWDAIQAEATKAGVPMEALRCTSAQRDDIPSYLALASVSPVFIRPTASKAGCSPTKVGELFAMNVPIIANSGYGDIDEILSPDENGSAVIRDFKPETLRAALEEVLSGSRPRSIRAASGAFSLDEGTRRYDRIYRTLAGDGAVITPTALAHVC